MSATTTANNVIWGRNFLQPLTSNIRTFQSAYLKERVAYSPLYNQVGFTLMPVLN